VLNDQLQRLDRVFSPRSVAVVGASGNPGRVGHSLVESIVVSGFKGEIYPINPKEKEIAGLPVWKDLKDLPSVPDLVVVGLNQFATVDVVETCGQMGVAGVLSIAGGFKEMGQEGADLEARLVDISRQYGLHLIGPNSLGMINTAANLNTTFYPMKLKPGGLSILSQSGGVGLSLIHKAVEEGLDICKWVGVGNRGTLEFKDYLQYLLNDPPTKVIAIFMESTEDARGLVEEARKVAAEKPVVIFKGGNSELAQYAALTHTGSLAGSPKMYRDIFRQNGIIQVESLAELVAVCKALSISPLPSGEGLGIITHTAGPSIVMVDELSPRGCNLPPLTEKTIERVKAVIGENPPIILKNPLDVAGLGFAATPFGQLAEVLLDDPGIDLAIGVYCLHKNWPFPTKELLNAKKKTGKPVVACYISTLAGLGEDLEILHQNGIPVYTSVEEAAYGAAGLIRYARIKKERGEGCAK